MINVANMYNKDLEKLSFSNSYDIRIHGVQTALSVMGFLKSEYVNSNELIYGYFCVNTEHMIKGFQKDVGLPKTGRLDTITWKSIFSELTLRNSLVVIKTGNEEISLYDFRKFLDGLNNGEISNGNTDNGDGYGSPFDFDTSYGVNINEYIDPRLYNGKTFNNFDRGRIVDSGLSLYDKYLDYTTGGGHTGIFDQAYNLGGGSSFDEFIYNYIVSGGRTDNGFNYNYNLSGSKSNNSNKYIRPTGSSNVDYNYIYNLLANSIYNGEFETTPLRKSNSENYLEYYGTFTNQGNRPYFDKNNIEKLRRQKFDMELHYGQNGMKAVKIVDVTPISVSQEVDSSGEPIYDVYEYIAKDVLY